MTRALWLFALFAAFFVVAVRFSSAPAVAGEEHVAGAALSPADGAPSEQAPPTSGSIDDDSDDDGVDALWAPEPAAFAVEGALAAVRVKLSEPCRQLVQQSHARGLERPPRFSRALCG